MKVEPLGLTLSNITPELKSQYSIGDPAEGLVVTEVAPDSPAADESLRPGDLVAEVQALTKRLAAGPTAAFGAIRRSVGFSQGHDLPASLEFEAEMMALTGASEDHRNAVDSFIAKRKPVFEGR